MSTANNVSDISDRSADGMHRKPAAKPRPPADLDAAAASVPNNQTIRHPGHTENNNIVSPLPLNQILFGEESPLNPNHDSRTNPYEEDVPSTPRPTIPSYVLQQQQALSSTEVLVPSRRNEFAASTWWLVDLEHEPPLEQGGTYLVTRCLRVYDDWDVSFARRVLKAYRTFLQLAANTKDWSCRSLVAPHYVELMWRVHRADVVSYCHDCMLLMGHVLGSNLLGEDSGYPRRQAFTLQTLREHVGRDKLDKEIWNFHEEDQDDDNSNHDDEEYHDSTGAHNGNDHQDNSVYSDSVMTVAICYQGNMDTTTYFKIRSDTCMAKVFENIPFCKYGVRREDEIEYYLSYRADETCHDNRQRTPIQPTQTAAELQLIDGDQINLTVVSNLTHDNETSENDVNKASTAAATPDNAVSSKDTNEERNLQINQKDPELNQNLTADDGEAVAEEQDNDADSERSYADESVDHESTGCAQKDNVAIAKSHKGEKVVAQPSPNSVCEMGTMSKDDDGALTLSEHCYTELSDDVDAIAKDKMVNYKHSFDKNVLKDEKERVLAVQPRFKKKNEDYDNRGVDDDDEITTSNSGDCKSTITIEKGNKKDCDNKSKYCYTELSDDDMATIKHTNTSPQHEIRRGKSSESDGFFSCDSQGNTPTRPIKKRKHRDIIQDVELFSDDDDELPPVQPIRARKDIEASHEKSSKKNANGKGKVTDISSDSEDRASRTRTPKKKPPKQSKHTDISSDREDKAHQTPVSKKKRPRKCSEPENLSDSEDEASQTQVFEKKRSERSKTETTAQKQPKNNVSKEVKGLELWGHHSKKSKVKSTPKKPKANSTPAKAKAKSTPKKLKSKSTPKNLKVKAAEKKLKTKNPAPQSALSDSDDDSLESTPKNPTKAQAAQKKLRAKKPAPVALSDSDDDILLSTLKKAAARAAQKKLKAKKPAPEIALSDSDDEEDSDDDDIFERGNETFFTSDEEESCRVPVYQNQERFTV